MTTKEKLIREINKLPEKKVEEVYKLLSSIVNKKDKKVKLKTYKLGGKFDNVSVRELAYEKNSA
ncbi:MAG: hypothetical protein HGGPFJEG_00315 [Ignavibacteria bacterium]|nr:hypothetical protein [Ignavibacteria bacterium]